LSQHTLSVIVEDRPGVLARVSAMFSNRGFNIHSLAVGPTHGEGRSRITHVADAPHLEQLQKQLHKLVNVITVYEYDSASSLETEVLLARVACDSSNRGAVGDTAALFGARMVDMAADSLTFELSGTPDHLRSFLEHISPFGLLELVKSGRIALKRTSTIRPSTVVGAS
jgi:acetolactate synthase-1/3 small subunit